MAFLQKNLDKAVLEWRDKGLKLVGNAAEDNVDGKVLKVRSGDLGRDVQEHTKTEGPNGFSIGTSLVYGKAWEKGFSRKAYTVRPRGAKALKIPTGGVGEFVFRLRADIPAQTFAAKPFLRPAIDDNRKDLRALLALKINQASLFSLQTVEIKLAVA